MSMTKRSMIPSPNRVDPPPFHQMDARTFEELCCSILGTDPDIATCDLCRVAENERKSARSPQLLPLRQESRCAQFRILPQYPESRAGSPTADRTVTPSSTSLLGVTAAARGSST